LSVCAAKCRTAFGTRSGLPYSPGRSTRGNQPTPHPRDDKMFNPLACSRPGPNSSPTNAPGTQGSAQVCTKKSAQRQLMLLRSAVGLTTVSAHARGMAAVTKKQKTDKTDPQKAKADDKAYNAALTSLPDKPYDPWQGATWCGNKPMISAATIIPDALPACRRPRTEEIFQLREPCPSSPARRIVVLLSPAHVRRCSPRVRR
jgi:hypothetical protein